MAILDWMGTFGRAQVLDVSHDLERGYESALLIQSIELEHYNDRPVRPELELSIPRSSQARILRRFRAALAVCREALETVEAHRAELAGQELRQLQLIEAVVARYDTNRRSLPSISRSPEVLPRRIPAPQRLHPGFSEGAVAPGACSGADAAGDPHLHRFTSR
jgi:hypothetical protein